ncbi:MAG: ABC transporter permease [Clostridia bacterium]|nr:ABC transporter permease [Clostridia bacterium]MBQ9997109.1 ABC transporter permease [Clostridia bacterium]
MSAVYKKELKTYFTGMTGPVFICFILLMTGIFTVVYNLQGLYPNFEVTVNQVVFVYLLAIPVLTMRSIAEEKHSRTDQLLYSLPMSVTSIVIAKYLAMVTVLAIPVCVMAFYPLLLATFGTVHLASAYGMLLAFFLLGASLIAIGMFISSLTESQVIAAVVSLAVTLLVYFMSGLSNMISTDASVSLIGFLAIACVIGLIVNAMIRNTVLALSVTGVLALATVGVYLVDSTLFAGAIPDILSAISLFDRLTTFQNGMFDLTAIIFYLSVCGLFVYLTVQSMEKKRWN